MKLGQSFWIIFHVLSFNLPRYGAIHAQKEIACCENIKNTCHSKEKELMLIMHEKANLRYQETRQCQIFHSKSVVSNLKSDLTTKDPFSAADNRFKSKFAPKLYFIVATFDCTSLKNASVGSKTSSNAITANKAGFGRKCWSGCDSGWFKKPIPN